MDAVELVEHNIEVFWGNTEPDEQITIVQGNALNLSSFPDDTYDITLLLGPLYHLYTPKDKRQALGEAIRVTKPGGVIFAAYVISDGCLLDEGFKRGNVNVAEYIKEGLLDAQTSVSYTHLFQHLFLKLFVGLHLADVAGLRSDLHVKVRAVTVVQERIEGQGGDDHGIHMAPAFRYGRVHAAHHHIRCV